VRIYTKRGDDGTTGLLFGGRVQKSAKRIELNGAVDEAQAALGMARAELERGSDLHELVVSLERDLWVLMAEVATAPANRKKLVPGQSAVTEGMVAALEARIDELSERTTMPTEFVVPGENRSSAALDVARTSVRRAERTAVSLPMPGSLVVPYLNRLSDLVWTMARVAEGEGHRTARTNPRSPRAKEG